MNSEAIVKHYQELYSEHGNAPESVQWADEETQYKRFEILSKISTSIGSVLDVGCGLGDFYKHLKSIGFSGEYLGVDIVPEFVQECIVLFASDENAKASLVHLDGELPQGYDYVFASGIFNNKRSDNFEFMKSTISDMISVAKKGVAFNALSIYVDYKAEDLYYSDPLVVFDYLKRQMGVHPVLKHDYVLSENRFPYEYTMYVHKYPTNN